MRVVRHMFKSIIRIGKRAVGDGSPCFMIAEAGANFRISDDPVKNYEQALRLIDIAAESGADAVKFQVYRAERLYVKDAGHAEYIGKKKKIYDIIREMELPYEWLPKLKKHCDDKGIMFLATPFDSASADELEKIGMDAYKTASYSITDFPLLKQIAGKGKPVIMSTGASEMNDVGKAVDYIKKCGNDDIILLQCTAKYPAPMSAMNLSVIPKMKNEFSCPVGLSDHSREPLIAPLGAVALGASVIEKHFTTDNNLPGPDHGFAILPYELKELVMSIHKLEQALGTGRKKVDDAEKELHSFARHFIYSTKPIKKGERFTRENIGVLRPGKKEHGLEPDHYEELLGRTAARDIGLQEPIREGDADG